MTTSAADLHRRRSILAIHMAPTRSSLLILLALWLTGCATIELDPGALAPSSHVQVNDLRSAEDKVRRHDALSSAIVFLEEERFKPRVLDLYVSEVAKRVGKGRTLRLDVETFRMVDFMGNRAGSSGMGFVGAALAKSLKDRSTDWLFVEELNLARNQDAIICILSGKMDGRPFKVAVSEAYRPSPFAGLVFNDPDFRRALNTLVQRAADESLRQAGAAP